MILPEEEKLGYRREFRHFATQYASAISQFEVDNGQWVGRLLRVYSELQAPDGNKHGGVREDGTQEEKDKDAAERMQLLLDFLKNEKISDLAISDVTYEIDANDPEGLHYFVRGFIEIKQSGGNVFAAGKKYRFEHYIKKTYHTKKTVFTEVPDIDGNA